MTVTRKIWSEKWTIVEVTTKPVASDGKTNTKRANLLIYKRDKDDTTLYFKVGVDTFANITYTELLEALTIVTEDKNNG